MKHFRDLYWGITDLKKDYQPRTNTVRDEKGDLVTDSHSILAKWRNHFSQLFNIHGVSDVRQREIHTEEPLLPEPSAFEIEMAIEKLKGHKSPRIDRIPAELIKEGVEQFTLRSINLLLLFAVRRNCLRSGRSQSLLPVYKKGDKTDCPNYRGLSLLPTTYKFYPTSCCQG